MSLDALFQFSQSSLQDYETCPRRFELRYLRGLRWPAVDAEPVQEAERLAQLGRDFHRLVHQHLVGLPVDALTAGLSAAEPELRQWWQAYLRHRPPALADAALYPELALSTPLNGHRLVARLDLLAVLPEGRFLIVDWKTAQRKPSREALSQRLQTRVYLYVLARAGAAYNRGQPLDPAAISMTYWYPVEPEQPETFVYSAPLLRRDEAYFSTLIEQIKDAARTADFPKTTETRVCAGCLYRSLCNRGDRAGPLSEKEAEPDSLLDPSGLDWEEVEEVIF